MKKILITSLLSFSFVLVAHADPIDVCANITGIQTEPPAGYIAIANGNCIVPSSGNPLKVLQVWGLTGENTKVVPPGTSGVDAAGNPYTCNLRTDSQGCSVLVELAYYKNMMQSIYAKLTELGLASQFPQFAYWGK